VLHVLDPYCMIAIVAIRSRVCWALAGETKRQQVAAGFDA
jgi:hypothetical protein